jgi:hypothetical protein
VAMYYSQKWGKKFLDLIRGVSVTPPAFLTVRVWTVAPDETGTGGTEFTGGGYTPEVATFDDPVNGTSGLVAKMLNDVAVTFIDMPFASTAATALSLHDDAGDLVLVNDSWTAPTWAAGDNVQFGIGELLAGIDK